MRVGIDFGTTHTVVAVVDRGNYPVVSFDGMDAWPSLIAANAGGQLRFGSDAAAVRRERGWSVLRSIKRLLNEAGPQTEVNLAGRDYRLADLLAGFLVYDRDDLGRQPVGRWNDGPDVEERYVVAPSGAVEVTLTTHPAGFERTFRLERHAAASL
jgi:molecular chaperone DnaK